MKNSSFFSGQVEFRALSIGKSILAIRIAGAEFSEYLGAEAFQLSSGGVEGAPLFWERGEGLWDTSMSRHSSAEWRQKHSHNQDPMTIESW